ncbi:MAG TPA: NADPH-dependent F420 reductase [Candidatus Acidoferrales bacterium]|nr:NADPH-dependent F420 reductase [Candidatus Acidoferrales bacterium]
MRDTIAIVGGTGAEGMGLALRWTRAGEAVIIGSRDTQKAQEAAAQITAQAGSGGHVSGAENAEAVTKARVVVLTVPFLSHAGLLKKLRGSFQIGTVLIDTTVPLAATVGGLPTRTLGVWQGSAAQQAAEMVPEGVSVVAAFQNVSAGLLNGDGPVDSDVVVCADDERARQITMQLAEKLPGVRAINGGRLENSRIVEQITALILSINGKYGVRRTGLRFTGLPIPDPR